MVYESRNMHDEAESDIVVSGSNLMAYVSQINDDTRNLTFCCKYIQKPMQLNSACWYANNVAETRDGELKNL
jgi:hypothetical protein